MDVTAKIITQFVKDLSFENPKGPSGFQAKDERPAINAQVDVKASNQKNTNVYEIEFKEKKSLMDKLGVAVSAGIEKSLNKVFSDLNVTRGMK